MTIDVNALQVMSPDFSTEGWLDPAFSQAGGDRVPRLSISGVPATAVELALVLHDPDAPRPRGFTHWLVYGIPPETGELGEDSDARYRPGPNDAGASRYVGPYPPPGHGIHHYYFWIYALSRTVEGTPSRDEFLDSYGDAIITQNRIVGLFQN